MAYAIVRIRKMSSNNHIAGMERHNKRTNNVKNANPDLAHYNKVISRCGNNSLKEDIEDRIKESKVKVRSNSVKAIEYLFTASPEAFRYRTEKDKKGEISLIGDVDKWNEFEKRAIEWMEKRHGKSNVVHIQVHKDEKTPHIHAYCTPIIEKTIMYKNRYMEEAKEKEVISLCARDVVGGLEKMYGMHDSFALQMEDLGLERGKRKSNATHQDVKSYYERVNKAKETEIEMSEFEPSKAEISIPKPPLMGKDKWREEQETRLNDFIQEEKKKAVEEFRSSFEGDLEKAQEYATKERQHMLELSRLTEELVETDRERSLGKQKLLDTLKELKESKINTKAWANLTKRALVNKDPEAIQKLMNALNPPKKNKGMSQGS